MIFSNLKLTGRTCNNLGDQIQLIAIDQLYKKMGISESDIFYLDKNDLISYQGEDIILPINMPLFDIYDLSEISPHIRPVFLGLSILRSYLTPHEVEYLKKHAPIGCRNVKTYSIMRKYGIESYVGGCITVIFPQRKKKSSSNPQIYIVDASEELLNHIPSEIKEDAVFLTHMLPVSPENKTRVKELALERYELYRENAGLVITPLLHCAVPCMAAGIPVIFAKDILSHRFGFCDKLIKIYKKSEYSNINWTPNPVYFEELKEMVFEVASKRINNLPCKEDINRLHNFYMDFNREDYPFDYWPVLQNYIETYWKNHSFPYKYSIWGLTELSVEIVNYIRREYPNAVLRHVYDKYRTKVFENIVTEYPDKINNSDETIFVTTPNAREDAKKLFNQKGKNSAYYIC